MPIGQRFLGVSENRGKKRLCVAGRGDGNPLVYVGIKLVTEGSDGNAQNLGRVRAVSDGVFERVYNEVTLNVSHSSTDESACVLVGIGITTGHAANQDGVGVDAISTGH